MKAGMRRFVVMSLLMTTAGVASAEGFYGGLGVGGAQIDVTKTTDDLVLGLTEGGLSGVRATGNRSAPAVWLLGGWRMDDRLGLELSLREPGRYHLSVSADDPAVDGHADIRYQAASLQVAWWPQGGTGSYPRFYFMTGVMRVVHEFDLHMTGDSIAVESTNRRLLSRGAMGGGVEIPVRDSRVVRLSLEYLDLDTPVTTLTAGFLFDVGDAPRRR